MKVDAMMSELKIVHTLHPDYLISTYHHTNYYQFSFEKKGIVESDGDTTHPTTDVFEVITWKHRAICQSFHFSDQRED